MACAQSSWDLSSSCSPPGLLETRSASGGAATKTKPGSIWSDIALKLICSQCAAFEVTAVASISMATAAVVCFKFAIHSAATEAEVAFTRSGIGKVHAKHMHQLKSVQQCLHEGHRADSVHGGQCE